MKRLYLIFTMCLFSYSFLFAQVGVTEKCVDCMENNISNTSSALGIQNTASGEASFASGKLNTSLGDFASSLGYSNTAQGMYSLAGGEGSIATGNRSLAFGHFATAEGSRSIALGKFINAYGGSSVAIGRYIKTTTSDAIVIGYGFNIENYINNNVNNSLMIGLGSNVATFFIKGHGGINRTGKVAIGNVTDPKAKLHIKADLNEEASLMLQPPNNTTAAILYFGNDTTHHKISASINSDFTFTSKTGRDFIFNNGNVGIGVNNPGEKLEVDGNIKINGDMNFTGMLNGQPFETTKWKQSVADLYYNEGNVGIGTNTPDAKIQVKDGDIFIEDIDRGIIMKSPDGNCWRGTVNNQGQMQFIQIDCQTLEAGIENPETSHTDRVKIYPNPAGNQIFITYDKTLGKLQLEISDINGRLISSQEVRNNQSSIDLSTFQPGTYLFRLTDETGKQVAAEKVIKE